MVTHLTQLGTGFLAAALANGNITFYNITYSQQVATVLIRSTGVVAMTEVSGQLYASDWAQKLYKISETTYQIILTISGTSNIMAITASLDGIHFGIGMGNGQFAYYANTMSSITAYLASGIRSGNAIKGMDQYNNVFMPAYTNSSNNVWGWRVDVSTSTLVGASTGMRIAELPVTGLIACLNGTGEIKNSQ
jgi:hypothetical protein